MKASRHKKVLGLALSERSALVAQLAAGDRPLVERLEEFVYPPGVSLAQPAQLGAALGEFLAARSFSAKATVVGVPAKWLVVRRKEVPAADADTLISMLRLQAEAEFSTELDLVYDFSGDVAGGATSVLLMATQRKHVEAAAVMCQAARLSAVAVTPTALALGEASGSRAIGDVLVLTTGAGGSELSIQHGATSSAIRHLRAPEPQPPFISELRRAVSTLPVAAEGAAQREMILWDGQGIDAESLGQQIGLRVRNGELLDLGVDDSVGGRNGQSTKYAAAVALAMVGLAGGTTVDFLHSRLAPPKERRVPEWAAAAAAAGAALILCFVIAYAYLQHQENQLASLQASLPTAEQLKTAQDFVTKVSFAQAWHGGDPRYLACLRDLTIAIPNDGETYATSVTIKDTPQSAVSGNAATPKPKEARTLTGQLIGKSSDQEHVQTLVDRMGRNEAFIDVRLDHTQDASRGHEVTYLIIFTYAPATKLP